LPQDAAEVAEIGEANENRTTDTSIAGAHLGLSRWTSPSGRGGFHYTDVKGYRVTAGLPHAASSDLQALHAEFANDCRSAGRKPLHFGMTNVALEFTPSGEARARWHIGDLPVFDLDRWRDDATIPAIIRTQAQRARRRDVTVRHVSARPRDGELNALRTVLRHWLQGKSLPPLRFMTTPFLFDPWPDEGVFVAEQGGKVVGILVASRALFGTMYRVDAVVRGPGAPNGTAELLVADAFRNASGRGITYATLGLAPLARRSGTRTRGWQNRLSGIVRGLGEPFYSFAGLEAFKAKFHPDAWLPLYCAASGPRFTPADILAVARAFAGGSIRRYAAAALRAGFSRLRKKPADAIPGASRTSS
jgi:phosphatidylglycerol lysyltransferase